MENVKLPEDSRWTVLKRVEDYVYPSTGKSSIRYLCRCECGTEKVVHKAHMKNGSSKSCGCLNREISSSRGGTGYTNTREYLAWQGMKNRVKSTSEKNEKYQGVEICQRWLDSFLNFFNDMGPCPDKYELERLDTNLGYFPENCAWASETRQAQNKGMYKNNTSGVKGVTWSPQHGKWRVGIHRNKKRYEGGLYESLEDAAEARKRLEILYPMEGVHEKN